MRMSESWQHKRIGFLCAKLGMTEEGKEALREELGVKSFTELAYHKARQVIASLEDRAVAAGKWTRRQPPPKQEETGFIKDGTRSTLTYYVIACAIHYCEFVPYHTDGGMLMDPDEVRAYVLRKFQEGRISTTPTRARNLIPTPILKHLYASWINPTCNKMLMDAGFRTEIKRMEFCYFDQLRQVEAQHLIDRFRFMYHEIEKQDAGTNYDTVPPELLHGRQQWQDN
ncbi:MAG TPA: hypothetical protein VHI13_16700 [Candidatus Kapabacteria bacterium]|nr:hypothetical protein [Candidatus Kapabacteria bacterium]